jgi:putative nucleotidyltransferase with HDIG domain
VQIPDKQHCLRIMAGMRMPDHIRDHSRLVRRVALFLTDELALAGVVLNRPLVMAAALLHDITKPRSFVTREDHARTGGEYLTALGYPEVADVVRQHVVLDEYFTLARPIEAEVVNYADKRVLHDGIVALDDRMNYILARYAHTAARRTRMKRVWDQTLQLEQRIFAYLPFAPLQLKGRLPIHPDGLDSQACGRE